MKKSKSIIIAMIIIMNCLVIMAVLFLFKNKNDDTHKEDRETKIEVTKADSRNDETSETECNLEETEEIDEIYLEDTEGFDIVTSYGVIQFPIAWEEIVRTEVTNENACEIVQFWATLDGKEEIHMFDIVFGGEGYQIGVITTSDSKEIRVNVESYTYELDDSWTDRDKEVLAAIDHDINYLLENLTSLEGYSSVN